MNLNRVPPAQIQCLQEVADVLHLRQDVQPNKLPIAIPFAHSFKVVAVLLMKVADIPEHSSQSSIGTRMVFDSPLPIIILS